MNDASIIITDNEGFLTEEALSLPVPVQPILALPSSQQTNALFLADSSKFGRWRMLCCGAIGAAVRVGDDSICLVGMVAVCDKQLSSIK